MKLNQHWCALAGSKLALPLPVYFLRVLWFGFSEGFATGEYF